MPKIEQTIADINVRAHTFKFITPASTETLKVPNACAECHATEGAEFADESAQKLVERVTVADGSITILSQEGSFGRR